MKNTLFFALVLWGLNALAGNALNLHLQDSTKIPENAKEALGALCKLEGVVCAQANTMETDTRRAAGCGRCPLGYSCIDDRCIRTSTGCESSDSCSLGYRCIGGMCVPTASSCESSSECSLGFECIGGRCE